MKSTIRSLLNHKHTLTLFFMGLLWAMMANPVFAKDVLGSTQTSYGVSNGGTFQFQIPVVAPQGRNGVQPNLSLNFSSSGGSGMAGVGWGVSGLGAITRCGKSIAVHGERGGVQHNLNDQFCLNGQPLILVSGTHGASGSEYRTEIDQFSKIVAVGNGSVNVNGGRAPSSWKVFGKGGSVQEYGLDASSAYKLPGTSSIHHWSLSRMGDRNGNYYRVSYRTDDGFPAKIDYTYGAGRAPKQQIVYNYEARPDVRRRYVVGRQIVTDERLKSITVKNAGTTVREYRLAYRANDAAFNGAGAQGISRLASVTEYGLGGKAMPPIRIEWQSQTPGYVATGVLSSGPNSSLPPEKLVEYYTFDRYIRKDVTERESVKEIVRGQWADLNGDGEVDMILATRMPNGSFLSKAYIKENGAWRERSAWRLPEPLRDYSNSITNGSTGRFSSDVINRGQLVDVNGDGLVDVVYSYDMYTDNAQTSVRKTVKKTYLNSGNGWESTPNAGYAPKDILFDYISNGANGKEPEIYPKRVETVRGNLIDVDGDGLVDWVTAYFDHTSGGNGNEYKRTWINNGSTWVRNTAYDMPDVFTQYRGLYSINHGQFVDVNGDGLIDWVQSYQADAGPKRRTWLNTGKGWNNNTPAIYNAPDIVFTNGNSWSSKAPVTRGRFVDINGDGLADWVRSYRASSTATGAKTWLNTGRGWVENDGYKPLFFYANSQYSDFERGWPTHVRGQHIDLNRDGLVDYVESYKSSNTNRTVSKKAWLNTGVGWKLQPASSPYTPSVLYYDYSGREKSRSRLRQLVDINSDGAPDWVTINTSPLVADRATGTWLKATPRVNLIKSVTTTMGVKVEPSFLPLTSREPLYKRVPTVTGGVQVAPEAKSFFIRPASYVTSKLRTPLPNGQGFRTMDYSYEGLQVSRLRGVLGFHNFSSTDSVTGLTQYTEFNQRFPFIGRAVRQSTSQGSHDLSLSTMTYLNTTTNRLGGLKTYFPRAAVSGSQEFELAENGGTLHRTTSVETAHDKYGNVKTQLSKVADGGGTLLQSTNVVNVYETAIESQWLISRVKRTTQTNRAAGRGPVNNVTAYGYHPTKKWLLTSMDREPDSTDARVKLKTVYAHDVYGNVTRETQTTPSNPAARVNTITYDSNHRLPVTLTNSLNQRSVIRYHAQCDQPTTVTDTNGLVSTLTYDQFCRQATETGPDQTTSTVSYVAGNLGCADCATAAKFRVTSRVQGEPEVTQYFNLFNQPLYTTTKGVDGQVIKQRTIYNSYGLEVRSSQPYYSGGPIYWTDQSYDRIGRPTVTRLPFKDAQGNFQTVNYDYSVVSHKRQRAVTDPLGRITKSRANALGQIVEVIDPDNKIMTYQYDSQGSLKKTIDTRGNSIKLNYDLIGRRIKLDDPDLGVSRFKQDGFGDLTSQTDAKGQTISMKYDRLGRLTERTVPGTAAMSGGVSRWTYDTAPKVGGGTWKGLINRVTGPNGYKKTTTYDELGRPIGENTIIKGITFRERFGYNADGYLSERYYPNSGVNASGNRLDFGVKYQYQNGYLVSVASANKSAGQPVEHWRADNYDALGRVTNDTVGSLIETTRKFKGGQNVLEQIRSVTVAGSQTSQVQNLNYTYDVMNNLSSRQDGVLSTLETFEYDTLDRLRFYRKGSNATEVRYNSIGNITYKSDVGFYNYPRSGAGSVRPHALSKVTGRVKAGTDLGQFEVNWEFNGTELVKSLPSIHNQDFEYDANGNATKSGDREISWTAFDKPQRMIAKMGQNGSKVGSIMQYGPEQQRVFKRELTFSALNRVTAYKDSTIYVGKSYERITDKNNKVIHRYMIQTGGATIQVERDDNSGVDKPKYLLTDNLGSTNVIINALGEVEQRLAFDPWGMRLNVGDSSGVNSVTNRGYTGHEMDDEVGLINMNARIYDPYLARFLSADPVLPDAYDMQSFNRYSYVGNNPMKYVDPTGNMEEDVTVEGYVYSFNAPGYSYSERFLIITYGDPNSGVDPIVTIDIFHESGVTFGTTISVGISTDGGVLIGAETSLNFYYTINVTITRDFRSSGEGSSGEDRRDNGEDAGIDISLGFGRTIYNPLIIFPDTPNIDQSGACAGFACDPQRPITVDDLSREIEQFRQVLRRLVVDTCLTSLTCVLVLQQSSGRDNQDLDATKGRERKGQGEPVVGNCPDCGGKTNHKPGKIGRAHGLGPKEVKDRIHGVKNGQLSGNPDVEVCDACGEVFPQATGGGLGDSIGNIEDF